MLQQTPVDRVQPVWAAWMLRWPEPSDLAGEPAAEAVRMWGRLGYPRRALRLHAAAGAIRDGHGDSVPADYAALRTLPGIGDYTASAVLAFAFRRRIPVLDTNVRRVLARARDGLAHPAAAAPSRDESSRLGSLLPEDAEAAALLSEALMELGATVCKARNPACSRCPLLRTCAWALDGRPDNQNARPAQAPFAGSDRQVRGRILQLARDSSEPIEQAAIDLVWLDPDQRRRAQASLLADGLLQEASPGSFTLPDSRA
jgi:A/G-specific adenine glycosylase